MFSLNIIDKTLRNEVKINPFNIILNKQTILSGVKLAKYSLYLLYKSVKISPRLFLLISS